MKTCEQCQKAGGAFVRKKWKLCVVCKGYGKLPGKAETQPEREYREKWEAAWEKAVQRNRRTGKTRAPKALQGD